MNLDKITQPFLKIFPGDFSNNPAQRQTPGKLFSTVNPVGFPGSKLIYFNEKLSEEIGLGTIEKPQDIDFLNSNIQNLPEIKPHATAYAGHQFGNWAGQLGDGRAIFAGQIINENGKKTELQWKGAGATPYSRHADGRAVLRSTVREFLMSEAMYFMKVPTSRALGISFTGEDVVRDIMYSGNPRPEKGAVMMRTAESFLRFGHFEFLFASQDPALLQKLADFTIENYFPKITSKGAQKYLDFFAEVSKRTAALIVEWFRVGFVHGVMNTDNMSVLGLTIDYGPYSMLDAYDLAFTPNTTDLPGRRYAFGEQGRIAQWNLWQLANALFPLINNGEELQKILDRFSEIFWQKHDRMLCDKFGFDELKEKDLAFFNSWQAMMQELQLDYTLFFQKLGTMENFDENSFAEISYKAPTEENLIKINSFLKDYKSRISENSISKEQSLGLMRAANPKFILRNYLLFECIEKLDGGDDSMFLKLLDALRNPYENRYPEFNRKRPSKYDDVAGCSTLSCSS